jgi:hypothetical protein
MEQHMKKYTSNLIQGFIAVVIFVAGIFTGAKIIDSNQSIYAEVEIESIGKFVVGKQLDPIKLAAWDMKDKSNLMTGIGALPGDDFLAETIRELEKTGVGIFAPVQFEVKVHVTEDQSLNRGRASICESNTVDFYNKTLTIFDNRDSSAISRIIQVGAWEKSDSALCLVTGTRHIWVHLNTAKMLFPDNSTEISAGSELDLLGRVSNSCKIPQEMT